MVKAAEKFDFPIWYINEYLYDILKPYEDINLGTSDVAGFIPFFPAGQSVDVNGVYEQLINNRNDMLPVVFYFDRMIRLRTSSFPVGKREQVLYTIYGSESDCLNIGNVIFQTLDREDYSAQDFNKWMETNRAKLIAKGYPMKVFFRNFRVFQADESRDLVELDNYRKGSVHKYIIEYDYHLKDNPEFLEG